MLHTEDDTFVRAPIGLVYRRLTNLDEWAAWWPGLAARRLSNDPEAHAIRMSSGRFRQPLRLRVEPSDYAHDAGFLTRLSVDISGEARWWLTEEHAGTVVHHALSGETEMRLARVVAQYRASVRRGLWALKDALQDEVRSGLSLPA